MNWQQIRWRVATNIRDALESHDGMWSTTLFAVFVFFIAVLTQRGNKANLVAYYAIDLLGIGIAVLACVWQEGGNSRYARQQRTYTKVAAIISIVVSLGLIVHRHLT